MNLLFGIIPSPYRMDFYKVLHERVACRFYFRDKSSGDVAFDLEEVRRSCPFPVGHYHAGWGLGSLLRLHRIIREEKPGVVFVSEFSVTTLQVLLLRRFSRFSFKVVSICDDSPDMIAGNDFGWMHRLARRIVPRRLDNLVLTNAGALDWYRHRFGKGILMPILADETRVRAALARVLPLSERIRPTQKPIVAYVGRFIALKNLSTLVRAMQPLRDRMQLVFIGDGPERERLLSQAPWALFPGSLSGDDLLAWYDLVDVLVLPSFQEAYGAVTGEALMAGAQVIVSRKAGSSELVREGENGFVVDPDDPEGITRCLESLLGSLEDGRTLSLRANLHPYRFIGCMAGFIQEINSL